MENVPEFTLHQTAPSAGGGNENGYALTGRLTADSQWNGGQVSLWSGAWEGGVVYGTSSSRSAE
jgi:hypothetical protein